MYSLTTLFPRFQREIDNFFMHHLAMRSDQLQQEIAVKNLEWKLYRKKRSIARVKAINDTEVRHKYFILTHYHTIPTFNKPVKGDFWKTIGKRRNCRRLCEGQV